jgi:PKD repeat protein
MRKKTLASSIVLLMTALPLLSLFAAPANEFEFSPVQKGFVASGVKVLTYAPDRILVKFREASFHGSRLMIGLQKGTEVPAATTGITSVDALGREFGVTRISRPYIELKNKVESARLGVERWYMVEFRRGTNVMNAVARYAADPNVDTAQADYVAFPDAIPTDPMYPDSWGHNNTGQLPGFDWDGTMDHTGPPVGTPGFDANAQAAWDAAQGFGSASVIIAIIDTGADLDHPDLNLVAGYDFGDNDGNPEDDSADGGHGTCCSGIAAAKANNGVGACGIAPGCKVMPLKVVDSAGTMYFSAIQNALYYAADQGAQIVSMSFGAYILSDPATDTAILYAYNAGCVLLATTGNDNRTIRIRYPAINANVIGVGAASPCGDRKRSSRLTSELNAGVYPDPNGYTCDGERWWGSNYGPNFRDAAGAVDVIGPTILPTADIVGAGGYREGDYEPFFNGTSCAAPYAAGVCALIKSANPTWTNVQIRHQLLNTAIDIVNVESGPGWDRYSGYGMVNAAAAVGAPVPLAAFTASPTSGVAPLTVTFTDQSMGSPTSWSWSFGDGGTSTVQNPVYTYNVADAHTVTLIASSAAGSDGETKIDYISVLATCSQEGDPYLRYGWVCGDYGPGTCNIPGWNPPALPPPCAAPQYYLHGFDTVEAYPGLQLAMKVMMANLASAQPDTFCARVFGYSAGWTFSGNPALGSPVILNPGYGSWQTTFINVPCDAVPGSYNQVIIQENYYPASGMTCVDCGDNLVPNFRPCTSGDPFTRVMYREDTLFVYIVEAPPALVIYQDTLTLVERGQTQAYIPFQICNQDECAPLTTHNYNIKSKGHIGTAINTTGSEEIPGGECRDVYGVLNAGTALACAYDTLTIIVWAGSPAVYDTCVQVVHVIVPLPVPLFTAPVVTILVLALILAAAVFMRRRAVSRV